MPPAGNSKCTAQQQRGKPRSLWRHGASAVAGQGPASCSTPFIAGSALPVMPQHVPWTPCCSVFLQIACTVHAG